MTYSTATVATDRPERYIKQLVSHMSNKVTTQLDENRGTITLRDGQCELTSSPGQLHLAATAADADALVAVEDVITRHLLRFATQDELVVAWSSPVEQPASTDSTTPHVEREAKPQ